MVSILLNYFFDPILRAPTLGSMLMCLSASLIGVLTYLRKESLIGEALSHATYPGVMLGALLSASIMTSEASLSSLPFFILGGAALSSLIGIWTMHLLIYRLRVKNDAALCFVLSTFFGLGVLIASRMQFTHTLFYKQAQVYLWGQAATMTDIHILLYGILFLLVAIPLILFYKEIKAATFDRNWAQALGLPTNFIDTLLFLLIVLSLVAGIRSVGVVLMSAMLIAPAISARQFTDRLSHMFLLSMLFGCLSAFLGNVLSFELSNKFALFLPTGPMIVLVSALIAIYALLFAPSRGLLIRLIRKIAFRLRTLSENILKTIYRQKKTSPISFDEILAYHALSPLFLRLILYNLTYSGWLKKAPQEMWCLTQEGSLRAQNIIRLHRLWEVYLVDWVGESAERVHKSAEEMEHVLTQEVESELSLLLKDPKTDPHHQPIPPPIDKL